MIKKTLIAGLLSGITITSALAADNLNVNVPNVRAIIPPPPKPGTLVYQNDMDVAHASFFVKNAKRYKQASLDSNDSTPGFAKSFEKAFGHTISKQATPVIWKILNQLDETKGKFTHSVKAYYPRLKPFAYFHEESCKKGGHTNTSYPSGHATLGWAVALTLSQINPARATEIMKRGYEFGQSGIVCGRHYPNITLAVLVLAT